MNEREVHLPVSGGRAWVRTRLADWRMDEVDDARTGYLPAGATLSLYKSWEDGTLSREASDETVTEFLLARGFTAEDLRRAHKAAERRIVTVVTKRWENVRGPENDDELELPDGIKEMHPADFEALLLACNKAVADGRADPNAGSETSPST